MENRWHSITEKPERGGVFVVADRNGNLSFREHSPFLYYPFNLNPEIENGEDAPVCWAYIPELSEEFTSPDVIKGIKDGTIGYKFT